MNLPKRWRFQRYPGQKVKRIRKRVHANLVQALRPAIPSQRILPNDSFEEFQIDISSTDDHDHFLSFESLFSFEETPNAQGS
jgi:hypothetical protein